MRQMYFFLTLITPVCVIQKQLIFMFNFYIQFLRSWIFRLFVGLNSDVLSHKYIFWILRAFCNILSTQLNSQGGLGLY